MNDSVFSPDLTEYNRQIDSFNQIKGRPNPRANIWFFDSPKNDQRQVIATDLLFMHVVLLEGDVNVIRYALAEAGAPSTVPALRVYRQDGEVQWWHVAWNDKRKRAQKAKSSTFANRSMALQAEAAAAGANYVLKTELDLRGQEILFDNWLNLCAAITRCRTVSTAIESVALKEALRDESSIRLGELLHLPDTAPAQMLALVALFLQRGALQADLERQLLGPRMILTRSYL